MKSRDSRDFLSVFRLRERYNKQTKFSLNNNYITMERKYQDKCSKKGVTTEEKDFINFCSVAAQIKLIWFLQTVSEASEEKNYNF